MISGSYILKKFLKNFIIIHGLIFVLLFLSQYLSISDSSNICIKKKALVITFFSSFVEGIKMVPISVCLTTICFIVQLQIKNEILSLMFYGRSLLSVVKNIILSIFYLGLISFFAFEPICIRLYNIGLNIQNECMNKNFKLHEVSFQFAQKDGNEFIASANIDNRDQDNIILNDFLAVSLKNHTKQFFFASSCTVPKREILLCSNIEFFDGGDGRLLQKNSYKQKSFKINISKNNLNRMIKKNIRYIKKQRYNIYNSYYSMYNIFIKNTISSDKIKTIEAKNEIFESFNLIILSLLSFFISFLFLFAVDRSRNDNIFSKSIGAVIIMSGMHSLKTLLINISKIKLIDPMYFCFIPFVFILFIVYYIFLKKFDF